MRISELLYAVASWLEDPNNEALLLSEYNDECLEIVAKSCVQAAFILKNAAEKTDLIEPQEASNLTPESIKGLAEIATAFDLSGDPELQKQASVIDELLLTISASKDFINSKIAEDDRINELKKKYKGTKEQSDELIKTKESEKAVENSEYFKDYVPLENSLQTRYCPDHPGVMAKRVTDNVIQCPIDKKTYNYEAGFQLMDGSKVPGTTVQNQTKMDTFQQASIFDSREQKLNK
ncbi:MAG: hypothetical protein LC122_12870 [Chitinophagales bacterium]|nr:hypothetical protein [Chitinophagales bacterium]